MGFARRKELLEELAKSLASAKGKLYAVQVDMTKEDDILKGFQWVKDNVGPVHVLVNNAGTATQGSLLDGSTSEWKTTLDLNVLGLCIATREATKVMREQGIAGHVIHINSVLGHTCTKAFNVYCASKHAVTALTETLRQELNAEGSKIKISVGNVMMIHGNRWLLPRFSERQPRASGIRDYKRFCRQAATSSRRRHC